MTKIRVIKDMVDFPDLIKKGAIGTLHSVLDFTPGKQKGISLEVHFDYKHVDFGCGDTKCRKKTCKDCGPAPWYDIQHLNRYPGHWEFFETREVKRKTAGKA